MHLTKMNVITEVYIFRWQYETSEIILKMENRIQDLNEKYEEVKQENLMIKKQWKKEIVKGASEEN